ncbi:MAG TPA: glycoside hydrolase family 13 protein [Gaiellaceae bacterium]|jgi:alpha-glucosidase|nr:glycoside hydrolase family 13 protein [Gaiellaceae bacterium]
MTIVGGERASALAEPHHDGSELYVVDRPDEVGGTATLRLRTPSGAAEQVWLRFVTDGEPRTAEAVVDEDAGGETWWRAELPVPNAAVRYRWLVGGGSVGNRWVNGLGMHTHEVAGADDFVLVLDPGAPAWHARSVVYEIFPDRFASSGAADGTPRPDWAVEREWDRLPEGRSRNTARELYGGDLRGVEQHLDHIEGVGANVIYMTPFFPARSAHRYDASSFERVDPLLGGDAALHSLIAAAHARDIRIVGDLTLNHCGAGNDWFLRAEQDPSSPEREMFFFDGSLPLGYACWIGVRSLPTLNWGSSELRTRMDRVFRHWLAEGLDGWRIDVANMVGRHRLVDVNHEVGAWSRERIGEGLLLAEHGHDYRPDLDGRGWHGVMNYSGFLRPTWWWLHGGTLEKDVFSDTPAPAYSGPDAVAAMRAFRAGVSWDAVVNSWALLDSHDTARFRTVTASRAKHVVGIGMQMTTPGVPMLFAGDEIGLEGEWGEDARRTMPWDREETWDRDLLRSYRELIALRRSSHALAYGGLRYVHVSGDAIAYVRESREERLLCLAARAPHDPVRVPFTELETVYGEDARDGVLPADGPSFHIWRING